jgi:hypothetical protein
MKVRDFLLGRDADPIVRLLTLILSSLGEERRPFARPSTVD